MKFLNICAGILNSRASLALPLILAGLASSASGAETIRINEFGASNSQTITDQNGEYSDWIELYNASSSAVNLEGWYLTDDPVYLTQWRLPNTTLAPNGYLVVFASGKNRAVSGAQLHTSFSLSSTGEYLALVQPDGVTVASAFAPQFPLQFNNISYGVGTNGSAYFPQPTPGATNGTGLSDYVRDTKFDSGRGFYNAPFSLKISTATTGATIRYTTNGLAPTATTGFVYAGPITISGTSILRAAAFKDGLLPSNVDTQTYLFVNDIIQQSPAGQTPAGWPDSWSPNVKDYGMDPEVVTNALYSGEIKDDLKALPSFSIVMKLDDLFNSSTGIYANSGQDGRAWERLCSLELIYPDGTKGFQIDAGIRIRGGYSRSSNNPKHGLRFLFREEYGNAKLEFPLFGDNAANAFDNLDLRTFQNYSWSFEGDTRGVFIRDMFSRDTQLAMGLHGERGNYFHLYINGQYWGIYNTAERPEASYAETYFGGSKNDYDVVKVETDSYTIFATDGNMLAWNQLYNFCKTGLENNTNYQRVQGNNPDGTRNPAYPNLLDMDNLIDYMLVILYAGNLDAPVSNFIGNNNPNNWYGIRSRTGSSGGFKFFAHDSEHTLLDVNQNRNGPWAAGNASVATSSPQWLWQQLRTNAEFRLRVADHVQKHFFNGGVLTPQAAQARFAVRTNQLYGPVVAESARWGDSKVASPRTRANWLGEVGRLMNSYFPQRSDIVLNQLKVTSLGLYPSLVAPTYSQHGGHVNPGASITISAPAGTIYYTLDGSDPRLSGGAVAPGALTYSGPLVLKESSLLKSRVLSGTTWSALNEASFTLIQTFTDLLVTEFMYHAPAQNQLDGDFFEFIELKNVSSQELDLSGVQFTNGIQYTFPNGSRVQPGHFVVLARDAAAFALKYPGVKVDGIFSGKLSDNGETLSLVHAVGTPIFSVTYNNKNPWPLSADGQGFSLVPVNPNLNSNPTNAANWRSSSLAGGSPGADDPSLNLPVVLINELLTHADPVEIDTIELYNPSATDADISHWYLTDNRSVPKKFRFPSPTVIPAGGYRVFNERDFNPNPGVDPSFSFSSRGEEVYLFSADAAENLTGYSDGFSFGAAENGFSFGRYTNSVGEILYPPQRTQSFGAGNPGPRVGPVVFNEINYDPAPGEEVFIELKNISANAVKLFDPQYPTNSWRLNGVDFSFPPNLEVPAQGLVLLVSGDPVQFRSRRGIPPAVMVLGPFGGVLQRNGELLQLLKPDAPEIGTNGAVTVPYVTVEEVRYDNRAPWPIDLVGKNASLERINPGTYGNDPANWRAAISSPSPGLENDANRAPRVNAGPDLTLQSALFPFSITLSGTASDDGKPNPPGSLTTTWTQSGGPAAVSFDNASQSNTLVSFPGVGTYTLRFAAGDGALGAYDEVNFIIEHTPANLTLLPRGAVWKYLDDGSNQGTNWQTAGFNDAAWKSGPAQLGYGDGDEATTIGFGPNAGSRYITTYFRRTFTVTNAASFSDLKVSLLRDDGAVVYLNGTNVFQSNMPLGAPTSSTVASSIVSGEDETSRFYEQNVDTRLLREGTNQLAVEIHQSGGTSSDLSFDLELLGTALPDNQAPRVNAGEDFSVTLPTAANLTGSSIDDGLPLPPAFSTMTWFKVSGPGTVTFAATNSLSTSATFNQAGNYTLRLTVNDGQFTSSDEVLVTVNRAVPNPARIDSIDIAPGALAQVRIRFMAAPGNSYSVQFRDSLTAGVWVELKPIAAQQSSQTIEVTDGLPQQPTRFYRIVTNPVP